MNILSPLNMPVLIL